MDSSHVGDQIHLSSFNPKYEAILTLFSWTQRATVCYQTNLQKEMLASNVAANHGYVWSQHSCTRSMFHINFSDKSEDGNVMSSVSMLEKVGGAMSSWWMDATNTNTGLLWGCFYRERPLFWSCPVFKRESSRVFCAVVFTHHKKIYFKDWISPQSSVVSVYVQLVAPVLMSTSFHKFPPLLCPVVPLTSISCDADSFKVTFWNVLHQSSLVCLFFVYPRFETN